MRAKHKPKRACVPGTNVIVFASLDIGGKGVYAVEGYNDA